jgi:ESS family glutamate:Na+ symporter
LKRAAPSSSLPADRVGQPVPVPGANNNTTTAGTAAATPLWERTVTIELSGIWTLTLALVTIEIGKWFNRRLAWLEASNIPPAVSAGLAISLLLALLRETAVLDVQLTTGPRDVLLLVFFATLGMAAHLGRLLTAGRTALVVCVAIVAAITLQNGAGIAVAQTFGQPATLGLFMGSIAFIGGHGTATAWAAAPQADALTGAFEIGIGSATLGLIVGGVVAGPVAGWMMKGARASRSDSHTAKDPEAGLSGPLAPRREHPFSSDRWLPCLLWILVCLGAGALLKQAIAGATGFDLPGFLTAMLVGVALTNIADALRKPLDTEVTDLIGTVALRIFLAIALLSLDWSSLLKHLPMILTATAVQIGAVALIAVTVVYLLDGRDRDAAVASGGFMGFALGAMPVGLAVMRRLNARYGDTPRALLGISIAASLFQDTANALLLTLAFRWLG